MVIYFIFSTELYNMFILTCISFSRFYTASNIGSTHHRQKDVEFLTRCGVEWLGVECGVEWLGLVSSFCND